MSEYITRPVMRPPVALALVVFVPLALYAKTIDYEFTKESAVVLPLVCAAFPRLAEKQPWKKTVPVPALVGGSRRWRSMSRHGLSR